MFQRSSFGALCPPALFSAFLSLILPGIGMLPLNLKMRAVPPDFKKVPGSNLCDAGIKNVMLGLRPQGQVV